MKPSRACIVAMMVFAAASIARAQTATSSLSVSASVVAGCRISSVGNISYGSYDPLDSSPKDAEGNMVFRCVKGTSYKTYITGTRAMTGGTDVLSFQLYTDSARTAIFPSSNSGSSTTSTSLSPITQSIYGRISPGQDVAPASYNTTLVATVEY